jgi:Tol biopolymer transport system component
MGVIMKSGDRQRLLPDYLMQHYSISRDGQRVVFVSANEQERLGVWAAKLDGSSAPRRLTGSEGLEAFFGAGSDVFFAAQENDGTFVYRVKEDGSDLKKVLPHAVYILYGVSPDGKYLAAWVPSPTEENANAVIVYPVDGGSPIVICGTCAYRNSESLEPASWSADGKVFYFSAYGFPTYAIPLRSGQAAPPLPASGIRASEDVAALPGAKPLAVPGAFPGPDPSVYAYPKLTAQRNIYRVPMP